MGISLTGASVGLINRRYWVQVPDTLPRPLAELAYNEELHEGYCVSVARPKTAGRNGVPCSGNHTGVAGSIPDAAYRYEVRSRAICTYSVVVTYDLAKVRSRVRIPLGALGFPYSL